MWIKIDTYSHKIIMNFFEMMILVCLCILTSIYILGEIGVFIAFIAIIYMLYNASKSFYKIISIEALYKNCWWEPDKES